MNKLNSMLRPYGIEINCQNCQDKKKTKQQKKAPKHNKKIKNKNVSTPQRKARKNIQPIRDENFSFFRIQDKNKNLFISPITNDFKKEVYEKKRPIKFLDHTPIQTDLQKSEIDISFRETFEYPSFDGLFNTKTSPRFSTADTFSFQNPKFQDESHLKGNEYNIKKVLNFSSFKGDYVDKNQRFNLFQTQKQLN